MRILITADPELPVPPRLYGGIERIVNLLICELKQRQHLIGLLAHRDSTAPADHLFAWPGLRSQKKSDLLRNTTALREAVKEFKPDLVHSFSRVFYLLPLLAASLPKIMSYQRRPGARAVAWGARLARQTLTFTGCSEYICDQGRRAGGRWQAIHNFVDTNSYRFQKRVSDHAPLVFLSRVERIKGAHTAIAVALRTGRRLLIAGNHGTSGEEGRYWQEEILPYIGKKGIEYVGAVDDLQKNELLGQAAAMIVPIEWDEPFGIVFAEALACGTPVISCPRGALPEIVRNGVDGFLINNLDEACSVIGKLAQLDRLVCRKRAEACFSAQVVVDRYEQLYADLIPASQGQSRKITAL